MRRASKIKRQVPNLNRTTLVENSSGLRPEKKIRVSKYTYLFKSLGAGAKPSDNMAVSLPKWS
jgi:hypothetical protein